VLLPTSTPDVVYADDTTEALITYIYLAQDGVHSVSKSIPNLVETSDNIAIVRENEHTIEVLISIRRRCRFYREEYVL